MVYFDKEKVVSQFVNFFNERFKFNDDCRRLGPFYAKYPDYYSIRLESIDEDIALWSLPYYNRLSGERRRFYFYSNLKGEMLFDGNLFNYASLFSGGCSLVCNLNNEWCVVNLNNKELMRLPDDLAWGDLTDFRNNSLAMYDKESEKWGSYTMDFAEHSWQLDIPFIWDFLSLSRDPNIVYAGVDYPYDYYPNWECGPYNHMIPDRCESVRMSAYKVALLKRDEARTLDAFKHLERFIDGRLWADCYRTKYLVDCEPNTGDKFFHETTHNTGAIVNCGSLDDYSLVLSRIKK